MPDGAFLEPNIKRLKELTKAFADPLEDVETIYHYTTAEGFGGIIGRSEIWLGNTKFVNDTTECNALRHESKLFTEEELSVNRYVKTWWDLFLQEKDANNYYIASFSKESNSLEQWRAYGTICIGFEVQKLKENGFYLFECLYDKEEIRRWILEKADLKEWTLTEEDKRDYEERNGAASNLIFNASIKLKDSAYRNEKEVRLLAISDHNWEYPNSPSMYDLQPPIHFRPHSVYKINVPYVKFFISEHQDLSENCKGKTEFQIKVEKREKEERRKRALLPIKEVIVGPMVHQKETETACKILLSEKGYKDVAVIPSKIPYRGF